ncbi:MAG TPA: DUF4097 family beta strand repeat-containing protein [Candidatus Angelobacter sp.]|jgi:DUF4097 and DUF4098 domain-containing protein YvlB|nr:DUF4097 family beta strand repeat-containing protein [Candidatus Angelobacter sp.]
MKRVLLGLLVAALGVMLMYGREYRTGNISFTSFANATSEDCSDHFRLHNDRFAAVVSGEETRTIANQPLSIRAEKNGGIRVTTWDGPEFSVKLCKQVAADDESAARKILDETKLAVEGSTVSVTAPDGSDHSNVATLLLVRAPQNANVNLKVKNGGASLYKFSGTAEAETTNGGISLKDSTGKLTVRAKNGGISIRDCGGEVNANVANGGLSIALPERWEGKGLEAHTQNGGLAISVPKNFSSGLEVVASEYVGVVCRGTACQNAQKTKENGRQTLRLGTGEPQIRASTQNGGVVIKDMERENAKQ